MSKKKKKDEETEEKEAEAGAEAATEEGAEGEEAPKKGKKKLIIIIGAVVLVLAIVGGLFAAGVIGGKGKPKGDKDAAAAGDAKPNPDGTPGTAVVNKPVYYELPEFLVNLNTASGHVSFLKMAITLELKDQTEVALMDANKPRVMDTFNTYLRELKATDVQGSAGIYRLRDELLTRLNGTVGDGVVKDILFNEIIVQ